MEIRGGIINNNIIEILKSHSDYLKILENLSSHSSIKIGGPAKYFVGVGDINQLRYILSVCRNENIDFVILGAGSNILFDDKGFDGIVIHLEREFIKYNWYDDKVRIGSGVYISKLIKECIERELSGIEYLSGIPGTLGGAIISNAGTKENWISDVIDTIEVMTYSGEIISLNKQDISFGYRTSNLDKYIILYSILRLKKGIKNDILNEINRLNLRRMETQPIEFPSLGCVFRNPPGESAGKLIDMAHLKGLRCGDAIISQKHANFIINIGNATSNDVKRLISIIKTKIKEDFNTDLELEIKVI